MISLDRFAQGLPDPQAVQHADICDGCGGEIYPGETTVHDRDHQSISHDRYSCVIEAFGLSEDEI